MVEKVLVQVSWGLLVVMDAKGAWMLLPTYALVLLVQPLALVTVTVYIPTVEVLIPAVEAPVLQA